MLLYAHKIKIILFIFFLLIITVKADTIVVIDPGHGGRDKGASRSYFYEKYLVLDVAKMVKAYLESENFKVIMTRRSDKFIDLDRRVHIANKYNKRNTILVSIHFNSVYRKDYVHGIETFWYGKNRKSKLLAYSIQNELINTTGANSRGVKTGGFRVLRKTKMPSVLVELGFLTNRREREKIKYLKYRKKLASSIFEGIKNYYKLRKHNF